MDHAFIDLLLFITSHIFVYYGVVGHDDYIQLDCDLHTPGEISP